MSAVKFCDVTVRFIVVVSVTVSAACLAESKLTIFEKTDENHFCHGVAKKSLSLDGGGDKLIIRMC